MKNVVIKTNAEVIVPATPSKGPALQTIVMEQLADILSSGGRDGDPYEMARAAVATYKPRDPEEALLAAQLAALNHWGFQCLSLAGFDNMKPAERDMELRIGLKLINLHARLLAIYDRRKVMSDARKACPNSSFALLEHL